jgi:hypothetical protein
MRADAVSLFPVNCEESLLDDRAGQHGDVLARASLLAGVVVSGIAGTRRSSCESGCLVKGESS